MLNNSILVKEFSYEDDKSVDFSVDPQMYEKLGIKKAKKGEETSFDVDKLYGFQLEKDIKKIRTMKGSYEARNNMYLNIRATDPYYQAVASVPQLGKRANFRDLLQHTTETSWRVTSQPYGVIAHKRYLEYLHNLPKGPSEDEVRDRLQRKTDNELWENIQTGKLEPTRKDLRLKEKLRAEKQFQKQVADTVIDLHKDARERAALYKAGDFEGLRKPPTRRQFDRSMKNWHKGVHYPYNMERGFPVLLHDMKGVAAGSLVMRDKHTFESFTPAISHSSARFTKGERRGDQEYTRHMSRVSYNKAERFLKEHKQQMEAATKKALKEKETAERSRRRVGAVTANIADTLTAVKVATYQKEHAFTLKLVPNADDAQVSDSDDSSSSTDSAGPEEKTEEENEYCQPKELTDAPRSESERTTRIEEVSDEQEDQGVEDTVRRPSERSTATCFGRLRASVLRATGDRRGLYSASVAPFNTGNVRAKPSPTNPHPNRSVVDLIRAFFAFLSARCRSSYISLIERVEDWTIFGGGGDERLEARKDSSKKRRRRDESHTRHRLNQIEGQLLAAAHPQSYMHKNSYDPRIPKEQFLREAKAKGKAFRRQMRRLRAADKVMTAENKRHYAGIKRRYDALNVSLAERQALDQVDVDKAQRIQAFVDDCRAQLELEVQRERDTNWYKLRHWYSTMSKNRKKRRLLAQQQARQQQENILRPYSEEENRAVMDALVDLRTKEKEAANYFTLLFSRWTGIEPREKVVSYTVDDLILAAQSGRYKEVLDIVLHPSQAIGPNAVNSDGVTATYATLLLIMRNEVLLDDKNLDALTLTPWQQFKKKHRLLFGGGGSEAEEVSAKLDFVLQILLNQGGDVLFASRESGRDGVTVLHCAAEVGALDMVRWLLRKGVDPNVLTTKFRKTPLMVAAECDRLDAVMLLLRSGAISTVNQTDRFGWTALHYATISATPELCQVLMICGAKCTARNEQGRLPQEEATQRGRGDLALAIMTFKSDEVDHLSRLDFLGQSEDVSSELDENENEEEEEEKKEDSENADEDHEINQPEEQSVAAGQDTQR